MFLNAALIATLAITAPAGSQPADIPPPNVPIKLEVEAGNTPFLIAGAAGTQNYVCLPSATGVKWTLFGPQATLFDAQGEQILTHFLSSNPDEGGTPRATWQHSQDTSSVWAMAIADSSDPNYVAAGAIPWLLLRVVGKADGPTGGGKMTQTTFIQRVNTAGGVAPAAGCHAPKDIGKKMLVPYTTDYVFYR